eukprot:s5765_g1.t1
MPIAVDLAVSAEHGNILQSDKWEHLIRSRRIAGAHGAPPCKTYSMARWLQLPDQPCPQPLRDRAQPWGREGLNLKQIMQCHSGTMLMMQTLRLLLLVYAFGGSISLEHPKGEWDHEEKWCIWLAGLVRWLLLGPQLELCTFLQGPLGQVSPKPTTGENDELPCKGMGDTTHIGTHEVTFKEKILKGGGQRRQKFIQAGYVNALLSAMQNTLQLWTEQVLTRSQKMWLLPWKC